LTLAADYEVLSVLSMTSFSC